MHYKCHKGYISHLTVETTDSFAKGRKTEQAGFLNDRIHHKTYFGGISDAAADHDDHVSPDERDSRQSIPHGKIDPRNDRQGKRQIWAG